MAVSGKCFPRLYMGNPIMAVAAMFRRSVIDEVGSFDPAIRYSDDYDLWLRIAARHPVGYLNEPVARYRLHAKNNSHHHVAIRESGLQVLRKAERELPDACALVPRTDRQMRYFQLYSQMARRARWDGHSLASWKYHLHAAAAHPRQALAESVPASLKDRFRWYWSRLRG